jgi:hypothetical protein
MSLSRGTIPKPSTLGLIGQLTEGSQRSSLLKRRTLRASTIPWLPEHRKTGLPTCRRIRDPDRVPVDVFAKMKISLFRPRGMTRGQRNPEGKESAHFFPPKTPPF